MVLIWQIADDLLNSPNFPSPNIPTIWYVAITYQVVVGHMLSDGLSNRFKDLTHYRL